MKKTFIIEYSILDKSNKIIYPNKKIKVKNQSEELAAKIHLEEWCKKKYSMFGYLVIHKCEQENNILRTFNDIFGGFNNK
jgi:hypothetical protein